MAKFISLADTLGVLDPLAPPKGLDSQAPTSAPSFDDVSGQDFARLILTSTEFRSYILDGLLFRTLPPAVLCRLMDHGWGKPAERVEHTGKDGAPIITEIRRVIVQMKKNEDHFIEEHEVPLTKVTH